MTRPDHLPYLTMIARTDAASGPPAKTFSTLDTALGAVVGHKLFMILLHHATTRESERVYTNQPAAYPVGGRKELRDTAWARQILQDGRVLGTINLLHEEGWYDDSDVPIGLAFATLALPAYLAVIGARASVR